jgi:hypothetical protein
MPSRVATSTPQNDTLVVKPLASFVRLNSQVALYKPPKVSEPVSSLTPTTVVLCCWMNAASKHIDYYARGYMSLYPAAQIIVVTITSKEFIFESEKKRRADVMKVVHAILAPDQGKERLLVHSFSNGGLKRSYSIASSFQSLTGNIFAPKTLIFDSAPGMPRYWRGVYALAVPARKFSFLPRVMFMLVAHLIIALIYICVYWIPLDLWYNLIWGPMLGLKNPQVLDTKTVMGFVYSKEDMAIDWEDVDHWAKSAEDNGYQVEKKLVEGAEHAQMFRGKGGEEVYWGFVQRMWNTGMGIGSD